MSPTLSADCSRCAALCCVALAFDRSALFGFDKPAGVPCAHLHGHACSIHAARESEGFGGCVRYDCLGTGQRVTHDLFDGRSWQDDPSLGASMMEAFHRLHEVHELLELVRAASDWPLDPPRAATRLALEEKLATLHEVPACVRVEAGAFLRSLALLDRSHSEGSTR
jgi:hypothetical protein